MTSATVNIVSQILFWQDWTGAHAMLATQSINFSIAVMLSVQKHITGLPSRVTAIFGAKSQIDSTSFSHIKWGKGYAMHQAPHFPWANALKFKCVRRSGVTEVVHNWFEEYNGRVSFQIKRKWGECRTSWRSINRWILFCPGLIEKMYILWETHFTRKVSFRCMNNNDKVFFSKKLLSP